MDWNSDNIVAIGLDKRVYFYNESTRATLDSFLEFEYGIGSVKYQKKSKYIAVGIDNQIVEIFDNENKKVIETKQKSETNEGGSTCCMDWNENLLTIGCWSGEIMNIDIRCYNPHVLKVREHEQKICGMEWSPDNINLATGKKI